MLGKVDDGSVGCVMCRINRTHVGFSCEIVLEILTTHIIQTDDVNEQKKNKNWKINVYKICSDQTSLKLTFVSWFVVVININCSTGFTTYEHGLIIENV